MVLNTARLTLTTGLDVFYIVSQIITLGIIVPLNFIVNRSFTFADLAAEGR